MRFWCQINQSPIFINMKPKIKRFLIDENNTWQNHMFANVTILIERSL
jgi:hypothetical protein